MNSRKAKGLAALGLNTAAGTEHKMSEDEWARLADESRARNLAQVGATIAVLGPHLTSIIEAFSEQIYIAMVANGFWADGQDNFGSKTALVHTELSEMLEANRKSIAADDKIPEFTGEEAEAADTIIRLLDMAGRYNWRLGEAITAKMLFNLSRPFKHGKAY